MNRVIAGNAAFLKLSIIAVISVFCLSLALAGARQRAAASAFGPTPSHTNAPLEANCTACHSDFDVNSGDGSVDIIDVPASYTPGQQYTIKVKIVQADAVIYGFQLTAVDPMGLKAGSLEVPLPVEDRAQVVLGVVGPDNIIREYVEHKSGGLSNGQFGFNEWEFTWTAPSQPVGRVDFYAAGNAANSDGDTGGDYIYTKAAFSLPATAPVSISGRVTTPSGLPVRNTKVILTDSSGAQTFAITSSFGLYSFSNVPSAADYTVNVQSKRYRFAPRTLTPTGDLTDVNFVGLE